MGWLTVWPRDMMWVNIAFFACIVSIELQDGEESLLGHFHVTYLLHALLSFLLLFEQLALTAHVAAIALGCNVLAHLLHRLAGHNLGTDSCLNGNVELLAGNEFLKFLTHLATQSHGIAFMGKRGEGIDRLSIEQNVEFGQLGRAEAVDMVVERGITLADRLELVVEVYHYLAQRYHEMEFHTVAAHILLLEQFAACRGRVS